MKVYYLKCDDVFSVQKTKYVAKYVFTCTFLFSMNSIGIYGSLTILGAKYW